MKEAIIIIVVLILIFVPNYFFENYLKDSGNELIEIIESMEKDVADDNTDNIENAKKLKEAFLEKEKKWILIVDHEILDEIEAGVEECVAFYNAEDKMEFESSSHKLRNAIEDLARREETSIANVF